MKSYICVPCNHAFSSDERRPRCPKCMRVHDIVEVAAAPQARRAKVWLGAALAAVLLLCGGLLWLWPRAEPATDPRAHVGAPMATDELAAALAKTGTETRGLEDLLQADAALGAWAKAVAKDGSLEAQASALAAELRGDSGGNFAFMDLLEPRRDQVMSASKAFAAWKRQQRQPLYPLEVALIETAALRSLDVDAFVVEVARFDDSSVPLDPSGCLGYFAVALQRPNGSYHVVDPYGGRDVQPQASDVAVLSDLHVVAAALGIRALSRLSKQEDSERALREVEAALTLFPSSPALRSVRAVALAANGGVAQAEEAARAALQLRSDAPRYNNLATYLLESGDAEGAQKAAARAISLSPDYASAHLVLATVLLARGEDEQALAELATVEKLAPDLPGLQLAHAQYYAAQGQLDTAIEYGEREVAQRPDQPQLYLSLGRLYLATERTEDARRCANKALELAPKPRKDQMRKVIAAVLGEELLQ